MNKYNVIYNDDCLEKFKDIEDKSINLILIDPPYNIKKAEWDKWETVKDYVEWMGKVFIECERVLKNNGSFYFFHNDFMQIVELQNWLNKNTKFIFKQLITWDKLQNADAVQLGTSIKIYGKQRNYFNGFTEYCLFYTFQDAIGLKLIEKDIPVYKPMRDYCLKLRSFIGYSRQKMIDVLGNGSSQHFLEPLGPQWQLCTNETYNKLIEKFSINKWEGFRLYESLRQEYESLKYAFNNPQLNLNVKLEQQKCNLRSYSNIWNFNRPKANYKLHITPKPLKMIEHIIKTSSNEGDIILDCFLGSGTTAIATMNVGEGRKYIGIEKDEQIYKIAIDRVSGYIHLSERKN